MINRRDANEAEIIRALERVGASVQRVNETGCPDLIVGMRDQLYLLEVKLPAGVRGGTSHRELTPAQVKWWQRWKTPRPVIVRSAEEALRAIGALT